MVFEEFRGKRILVVEDGQQLGDATRRQLGTSSAIVIGLGHSVGKALALIDQRGIDAAILDLMLDADIVFPIVTTLDARKIPYVFATLLPPDPVPDHYRGFFVDTSEGMQAIAQRLFGDQPH